MDKQEIVMKGKLAVIESACGICALPEDQLLIRLENLYFEGFKAGGEATKEILQSVTGELSKIVVAHIKRDPKALQDVLEDFCKRHVQIVEASSQQKVH